jgi:hypothetical protein
LLYYEDAEKGIMFPLVMKKIRKLQKKAGEGRCESLRPLVVVCRLLSS